MELFNFLNGNYYVLVPALWVIGFALKYTPRIPDWSIIWILLFLSVGTGIFTFGFSFDALTNGVIAAGIAVFGHQMMKQTFGERKTKTGRNKKV